MKRSIRILSGIILCILAILIIRVHIIPKTKVEPNILKSEIVILRKQEEFHIDYICTNDAYTVYDFLMKQEWEESGYAYLKGWIYGVTLTGTLGRDDLKGQWVTLNSNDEERICKIFLYDDCVEINGIFYEPDNYSEIYSFFENYYNECKNKWPVYTIER